MHILANIKNVPVIAAFVIAQPALMIAEKTNRAIEKRIYNVIRTY